MLQNTYVFTGKCKKYEVLNDARRKASNGIGKNCDHFRPKYSCTYSDWKRPNWYRFEEPAGTQIPETIVPYKHCGTYVAGHISKGFTHPITLGEVVDAEVCFSKAGFDRSSKTVENCHSKKSIKIRNCGSYFLYELPAFGTGNDGYGAYCAVWIKFLK